MLSYILIHFISYCQPIGGDFDLDVGCNSILMASLRQPAGVFRLFDGLWNISFCGLYSASNSVVDRDWTSVVHLLHLRFRRKAWFQQANVEGNAKFVNYQCVVKYLAFNQDKMKCANLLFLCPPVLRQGQNKKVNCQPSHHAAHPLFVALHHQSRWSVFLHLRVALRPRHQSVHDDHLSRLYSATFRSLRSTPRRQSQNRNREIGKGL